MKIALCQLNITWEDKGANFLKIKAYLIEAAANQVDYIFFPEMSLTGFSMNVKKTGEEQYETVHKMKALSNSHGIGIGFGWVRLRGDKGENHYTIVKGDKVISDYVKIHPFSYGGEDQCFLKGQALATCNMGELSLGTSICYDLRFPELYQGLSKDVQVIVVAANWPSVRRNHWLCLLQARAIENQVYLLGVNCVGNQGSLHYSGDSCIINPLGETIEVLSEKEGLVIANVMDDVSGYQKSFPVKDDRRVDFYRSIL